MTTEEAAPSIHAEYLTELRRQRDEKKAEYDRLGGELRRLNDAVAAIEALASAKEATPERAIIVEATQFRRWRANQALSYLMLNNPGPFKARVLADTLCRGGLAPDSAKIFANIKNYLKQWRASGLVEFSKVDSTWSLTAKGREVFSAESAPADGQSLFAVRR